jgi:hypothetical protein
VAANQANAQKSTGPKTAEGKARVALNAVKSGAYAKADNVLRLIMRYRGEEPKDYDQLHQDLVDYWQPEGMEAMVVKTIADKAWEKLGLRSDSLESNLTAFQFEQIQGQRRQLLERRWPAGIVPGSREGRPGLWQGKGSPSKFRDLFQLLDLLEEWSEKGECPEEYAEVMDTLYGDNPTMAGTRIEALFDDLIGKDKARVQEARQGLSRWIARERRDVEREYQLYQRETALSTRRTCLSEKEVIVREATLERQMVEQVRLLLQLKSKRSRWAPQSEAAAEEVGTVASRGAGEGPVTAPGTEGAETAEAGAAD